MYYNGHMGYYPYCYHPYTPYMYGAFWHPYGFFVASLATTAVLVSLANQNYYYNQGIYYTQASGGYTVVAPPVNITVINLPQGLETIPYNGSTYYYFSGTFYSKSSNGYTVIKAPVGAVITNLPDGGKQEQVDGQNYVVYNNTYFLPIVQNGNNVYQVVEISS
jgi:hypothetical protein